MGGTANKPWDRILGPPQGDTLNNIFELFYRTSSVQSLSRVWFFVTAWTAARQASLSITNSWNLLKLISIELVTPTTELKSQQMEDVNYLMKQSSLQRRS